MPAQILIVEDEVLVAFEIEAVLGELVHEVVGIAPDIETALTGAMQPIDLRWSIRIYVMGSRARKWANASAPAATLLCSL